MQVLQTYAHIRTQRFHIRMYTHRIQIYMYMCVHTHILDVHFYNVYQHPERWKLLLRRDEAPLVNNWKLVSDKCWTYFWWLLIGMLLTQFSLKFAILQSQSATWVHDITPRKFLTDYLRKPLLLIRSEL